MRTIVLGSLGGSIYAAGCAFQSVQIRDNTRAEAAGAPSFLVHEVDGTSKFLLEDGSGSVMLEA